jgi:hypothetical protein
MAEKTGDEELLKMIDDLNEHDESMRRNFARIFGWNKQQTVYDRNKEPDPRTPTWPEVFAKVGALLEASKPIINGPHIHTTKDD